MGLTGIPPLSLPRPRIYSASRDLLALPFVARCDRRCCRRGCSNSHLGRTLRAVREDEIAARSYGVDLDRYKALAFAFGGFGAGVSGRDHGAPLFLPQHQTFDSQLSLLALTMVILGGMGNVLGAILGAVVLVGLPELFRVTAEYRILIYGVVLLLLIRFRPQGLLGPSERRADGCSKYSGLTRRFGGVAAVRSLDLVSTRANSSASSARTAPARRRPST